jgi:transposase
MWFLAHRKGSTTVVPDGRSFTEECPTCQKPTRFIEVAITSKYGVFFVLDMIKDEERAFRCTRCGDIFDLKDEAPPQGRHRRPSRSSSPPSIAQPSRRSRRSSTTSSPS